MTETIEEFSRHGEGQKRRRHHGQGHYHRRDNNQPGGETAASATNAAEQAAPPALLTPEEARAAISPLQLFSAYLLGVTENDRFKLVPLEDIARRFNTTPAVIDSLLTAYHLTKEDLQKVKGFDLSLARLDIKVAPAGISRSQVARQIFEEFELG